MKPGPVIRIDFRGGIVSPGDLYNILVAAGRLGLRRASFGLRQQMFLEVDDSIRNALCVELDALGIDYVNNLEGFPNIVSSFPAEEIFITRSWLSEGVYKDIFDAFDFRPRLKVNISDANQSFTPMLTGNINWVAAPGSPHYWHCFIRFPKTNIIYEAPVCAYTNDLASITACLEDQLMKGEMNGDALFGHPAMAHYLWKKAEAHLELPPFNLPYYEGLNRYGNKNWLGIYTREEWLSIDFLKSICRLCLETRIGQFCITPWKSIMIKSIEDADRPRWNALLDQFRINMRHAANELNFQVEDQNPDALALKIFLLKKLNRDDIRTFGICFGIKTRPRSEVFCNILIRRRAMIRLGRWSFWYRYDICCSEEFNPNKRTAWVFSRNNPRWLLPEQLRRAIIAYYDGKSIAASQQVEQSNRQPDKTAVQQIHQCGECLSVYDDPETSFGDLPAQYQCAVCDAPKDAFVPREWEKQSA
ncbi:rubredoxin [Flavihumibacter petaseus]|uniref:Rubredoxin-like domain-containing protein n=1 Tax=Flavihumibacter petaseus NBRC 106054 TaxID=1220578 RepID=A0A0E9N4B6_9BACT|nr:hypothetical protein [Flavihumibacter petaseus]GAO44822.1 hypothetical protein FPE01S_04_00650 [Flavihumibacter petaseus NBRC 106054]